MTAGGPVNARVIERERLPVGTHLEGPLVLTQVDSTTWVPPGWEAEVDPLGNLLMTPTWPERRHERLAAA